MLSAVMAIIGDDLQFKGFISKGIIDSNRIATHYRAEYNN
jgi:hypothetical protein